MRFSSAIPTLARIVLIFGLALSLGILLPASLGAFQPTPGSPGGPVPSIAVVSLQDVPHEDPEDQPYLMYVSRVDLPAGSGTGWSDHPSVFVTLNVTAGSICYTPRLSTGVTATAIFATEEDASAAHTGCVEEAQDSLDCAVDELGRYACPLADGDTVHLPVNSAVEITGALRHQYSNPDATNPAQVILAGVEVGDGAGCRGACY